MKRLLLIIPVAVAGCRTVPPPPVVAPTPPLAAAPAWSAPAASPVVSPPASAMESRIRQQAQIIEALVSQNDALTARLDAAPVLPAPAVPVAVSAPVVAPVPPPAAPPAPIVASSPAPTPSAGNMEEPLLLPNADGLIDLTVRPAAETDAPANPFAVRSLTSDAAREITLHVGGIIAGPVSCAVINDRLVQAGDTIETLAIERVEANAVFIRHDGRRLRLPVSTRPVRVRLPL